MANVVVNMDLASIGMKVTSVSKEEQERRELAKQEAARKRETANSKD